MNQTAAPAPRHLGRGLLYALIPIIAWGISFVVIKTTVEEIPPFSLAFFRFLIATLLLWPIVRYRGGFVPVRREDRRAFFLIGFLGVTTYFAFENSGLLRTSASHAAIIIALIPLCTELYALLHLGKKLRPSLLAASGVALAGVWLLVGNDSSGSATLHGDLLVFGAVASWVGYSAVAEKLIRHYPQLFLTLAIMVVGTVTLIPFALFDLIVTPFPLPSAGAWLGVLYLSVFCSILGYLLWNLAIAELGVELSNNLLYALPLIGVAAGVLLLGEPLSASLVSGGLLILGGVVWGHFAGRDKS